MKNTKHVVKIDNIDLNGQGIAKLDNGIVVFIYGALPNEEVEIEIVKTKKNFCVGKIINIISSSPTRTTPKCPNFGVCGGCNMQHFAIEQQIIYKEKFLIECFLHIGKIQQKDLDLANKMPPIVAESPWEYRHRARLSVRYVEKKNSVLIGFHEKNSRFITNMHSCLILPQQASKLIEQLRDLFMQLNIKDKIPQIELSIGENIIIVVIRHMLPFNQEDKNMLTNFMLDYNHNYNYNDSAVLKLEFWLQPKGPDSCHRLLEDKYIYNKDSHNALPYYMLNQFQTKLHFLPTDFIQINTRLNKKMVATVIELLDLSASDSVADFFCGLGNFTIAISKHCHLVYGFENNHGLINRANNNYLINQNNKDMPCGNISFIVKDLFDPQEIRTLNIDCNKWLIDPPRDGAITLIKIIHDMTQNPLDEQLCLMRLPQKIVYVSCNPATLARDANLLVNCCNYRLSHFGVIDMFSHTGHIESIAVFDMNI